MSELLDRLIVNVPAECHPILARLLDDDLRPPEELLQELEAYVGFVRTYSGAHPAVDAVSAEALAQRCRDLIDRARGRSANDRRLVQAACLYLVAIEGDLDTVDGFDDDAAVIRAVEGILAT